jgi:hypothetical protein
MGLSQSGAFFAQLKQSQLLGATLSQDEVDGAGALLTALDGDNWSTAWAAYGLATAYHETGHTLEPVTERGGDEYFRRRYDITGLDPARAKANGNTAPGDGVAYRGRGYVQLTWKANYQKAGQVVGADLVGVPELALRLDYAAKIMCSGMRNGWFTGKGLGRYIPEAAKTATNGQYVLARYVINGTDRAADIAGYATIFEKALTAGGWS